MPKMDSEIEHQLRTTLAHLYDPAFQPEAKLADFLGLPAVAGMPAVQSKILNAIAMLQPSESPAESAQVNKLYEVLHYRYVLHLTLEETALQLHMSVSSIWREQRAAINYLAAMLWRQNQALSKPGTDNELVNSLTSDNPVQDLVDSDWHEQTRRELASLYRSTPDAVADVIKVVENVLELERGLELNQTVQLEWTPPNTKLVAAVHPTLLRQLLISAIGYFIHHSATRKVTLFTKLEDGNIKITVTAGFPPAFHAAKTDLLDRLPLLDAFSAEAYQDGSQVFLWLQFPSVERVTVLVVDDNQDMIRLYQRATEGTPYRIVPLKDGEDLFDSIQTTAPDLIVLDVMLPKQDGWELLMQLHANQVTRYIPVIICSVVNEAELALALGATLFISKPVRPQAFIQALDQVLAQAL